MRGLRARPDRAALLALSLTVGACAGPSAVAPPAVPPAPQAPTAPAAAEPSPAQTPKRAKPSPRPAKPREPAELPKPGTLVAKNDEYVVWTAGPDDTPASLARRFLGSESLAWVVADFNDAERFAAGQEVVVPLVFDNPVGVWAEGHQTLPILCYHRFGDKTAKMVVTPRAFTEQMAYLAENGYRVVSLRDSLAFFGGRQALPRKAVVLTIDDGYKSSYRVAYPILKRFGFSATIFVYTDFVGAKEGLTWEEMAEMVASGLVDIQPHSKSHANLAARAPGESSEAAARRVEEEVQVPRRLIEQRLGITVHTFGYPYGDADELVVEEARRGGYRAAATVLPGGNPFFSAPYLLRRTMVFGEDDLSAFRAKVEVFRPVQAP